MQFAETQRFKRKWPVLAVGALNILFIYAIVQQLILKQPFGSKPASDGVLLLIEAAMLLLLFFIFSIKLATTVDATGIHYRFYPFQWKTTIIKWEELSSAYMRQYNSLYEYGGWGIRKGTTQNGNAVNTSASCSIGLQLEFTNGKRLLIGTARPEDLQQAVEYYFKRSGY